MFSKASDGAAAKAFPGLFGAAVWENWACGNGVGAAFPAHPQAFAATRARHNLTAEPGWPLGLKPVTLLMLSEPEAR